jgi:E3 ubiquitin-protein ligase HUWE1
VKFKEEEGVDQRGLSREWISCLAKELFAPEKGIFKLSPDKIHFYPNPISTITPDYKKIYYFIG